MLTFGYKNFARAIHVKKINELETLVNHPNFNNRQFFIENVQQFALDNLLDAIKISICFENYMKAKLILNKFVVHTIAGDEKYRTLKKEQGKRPIALKEMMDIESWRQIEGQGRYCLPGLTENTIQFNVMLNKEKYQKVIGLSPQIKGIISRLNDQRNSLHFLIGESGEYGKERVRELKRVIDFVETDLFILQNQLIDDLNLPEEKKLKKTPANTMQPRGGPRQPSKYELER